MRWFRRILFIVLAGGFFYGAMRFASQNADPVVVDYLTGQTAELELWKALALAVCAGALLTALPLSFLWTRSRMLGWQYRRTMKRQEAEIHQLRNLPLTPQESVAPKGTSEAAPAVSGDALGSGA